MGLFTSPSLSDLFLSLSPPTPPVSLKTPNWQTHAQRRDGEKKEDWEKGDRGGEGASFDVFACIKETKASNCKWAN